MLHLACTSLVPLRTSPITMKAPEAELRKNLEARNAVTEEPGRRGRFSKAWSTLEKDADWLGFVGGRCLDALDDSLFRGGYLSSGSPPQGQRPRVVVLGSGWGANAVLSQLKNAACDVTVVSPRNYFLFTPMLAGAALGTLEPRRCTAAALHRCPPTIAHCSCPHSIIEPIREANPTATYFEAEATAIDTVSKVVTCESVVCEGVSCELRDFEVPYDQLVVAVGASTNTFGVKGVQEHCLFIH